MQNISVEQSGAFVEQFELPASGQGPLDGLRFAVKDLIDVAGHTSGCGNPTWRATHGPAAHSAVCVEQLLAAGATVAGKTLTDELAFSLIGENHFYGTPLNPAAPDRVPGGSSSGSASAVACGLVDFALGTDTGGSVRVPASNCGLWGLRPTHDRISVAGVNPLAPTFDTVGLFARESSTLARAAAVLLCEELPTESTLGTIHVLTDLFELADADVQQALAAPLARLTAQFPNSVRHSTLGELCDAYERTDLSRWRSRYIADRWAGRVRAEAADLIRWKNTYSLVQWAEIGSCLGAWIAEHTPTFGPATAASFELVRTLDRTRVPEALQRRERFSRQLQLALRYRDLLCLPTAPSIAPLKGSSAQDRTGNYYRRALTLTSIAGIARLPQVSIPLGNVDGVPIGLSLIGGHGEDLYLLRFAQCIAASI